MGSARFWPVRVDHNDDAIPMATQAMPSAVSQTPVMTAPTKTTTAAARMS